MTLFGSPFPDWVAFATATAWETDSVEPHKEELATLSPMAVDARIVTFSIGRIAARRALEAFGHPETPVLPANDRSPQWPSGLVGSITHTAHQAAAAVTYEKLAAGIGLDIEDTRRVTSVSLARMVSDQAEQRWIAGDSVRLVRIFSAKEAIFKAFYPRHRAVFGFNAVHLDPSPNGFMATLRVALADWPPGSRFRVYSNCHGFFVLSSVLLPPCAGPQKLDNMLSSGS